MDENDSRVVFFVSLIAIAISGGAVVLINHKTGTRRDRMSRVLMEQLWGFSPPLVGVARYQFYAWSWRKLALAGVMLSSLCLAVACRMTTLKTAIQGTSILSFIWVGCLTLFWSLYIKPYWIDKDVENNGKVPQGNEQNRSSGWNAKILHKASLNDDRLPLTIVTGYLGSGKTTLVQNILNNTIGLRILVIENEIGEEGIDHDLLLQNQREDIILMSNGCICCTVRRDVIKTFHTLFDDPKLSQLNWVVIETTGLADPAPLIQSLYMDEKCKKHLRMDSILTVVDAKHIELHLHSSSEKKGIHGKTLEAVQQLCFADRVILNKMDLVSEEEVQKVVKVIQATNPNASIIKCKYSSVPVEKLLNIRAFDATRNSVLIENTVRENSVPVFLKTDANGKILRKTVNNYAIAGTRVSTVSLTTTKAIDMDKFNFWIVKLLQENGMSVYRLKGILNMHGYEEQFVAQGVHMVFDGHRGQPWKKSERTSRLVFIGEDLDKKKLEMEFLSCCADRQ